MTVTKIVLSLLGSLFRDFFYVIIRDFFAGFRDSLCGFFYVHKLENKSPPRPPKGVTVAPTTVLQKRRLKERKFDPPAKQQNVEEVVRKKASGPKLYVLNCYFFVPLFFGAPFVPYFRTVLQCIAVNLAFILLLYFLVIPLLQWLYELVDRDWPADWCLYYVRKCLLIVANILCFSFYVPLYLFIKIFNAIWCLDVSNAALRFTKVRSIKFPSFAYGIGDVLIGLLVELLFMIQTWILTWIDFRVSFIGYLVNFAHYSFLYALFSYEYVWMAKGIRLTIRLEMIERNWAYYIGFGAIMAISGMICTEFILSYFIFGMCFPFFIVSAYVTDGVKRRSASKSLPPLHLFWPSLLIANRISDMIANVVSRCFVEEMKKRRAELKEGESKSVS